MMMQSPKNHDLSETPSRSNLTRTSFNTADSLMKIANYKGNSFKETVSPFYTNGRRAATRTNYKVKREASEGNSATLDLMGKAHQTQINASGTKKNAWLNQFLNTNGVRQ
jgi:hypothetical protein